MSDDREYLSFQFRQGKNEQLFKMFLLKTIIEYVDNFVKWLPHALRLAKVCHFVKSK